MGSNRGSESRKQEEGTGQHRRGARSRRIPQLLIQVIKALLGTSENKPIKLSTVLQRVCRELSIRQLHSNVLMQVKNSLEYAIFQGIAKTKRRRFYIVKVADCTSRTDLGQTKSSTEKSSAYCLPPENITNNLVHEIPTIRLIYGLCPYCQNEARRSAWTPGSNLNNPADLTTVQNNTTPPPNPSKKSPKKQVEFSSSDEEMEEEPPN